MRLKPLVQVDGQVKQLPLGSYINLGKLNIGPATEVVAAISVAAPGSNMMLLNTGGVQNVEEITGGDDGDILVIRRSPGSNTIRIKKGNGNIWGGPNRLLNGDNDALVLLRRPADWVELSWNG